MAGLALALVAALPAYYLSRLFTRSSPVPRLFLGACARIVGARVHRIGAPAGSDVLYVANHVSWVDILALAGASGTAFVAKAELADTPLVGFLCRLNRTVFIRRENRIGVVDEIGKLRQALARGHAVTVFPEGTTSDNSALLPFKTSLLSVLDPPPPRVLVQPVLVDYRGVGEEIGWIGDESGLANVKRILARPGTLPLDLHFLAPFDPAEHGGRKAIGARACEAIETALIAARSQSSAPSYTEAKPVRPGVP